MEFYFLQEDFLAENFLVGLLLRGCTRHCDSSLPWSFHSIVQVGPGCRFVPGGVHSWVSSRLTFFQILAATTSGVWAASTMIQCRGSCRTSSW